MSVLPIFARYVIAILSWIGTYNRIDYLDIFNGMHSQYMSKDVK